METKEIRFKNLELLIREFGSAAKVAREAGTSPAYISQILTRTLTPKGEERGVGNVLARKLEKGCKKPRGWMDQIQHKADRQKYHDMLDALDEEELLRFEKALELAGFSRDIKKIDQSAKRREDKPGKSA